VKKAEEYQVRRMANPAATASVVSYLVLEMLQAKDKEYLVSAFFLRLWLLSVGDKDGRGWLSKKTELSEGRFLHEC